MNIKPCKINLPNLSPSHRRDPTALELGSRANQLSRNQITLELPRNDDAIASKYAHRRFEYATSMGKLSEHSETATITTNNNRGERHSLNPSDRCLTIGAPVGEAFTCFNHVDRTAKFKIITEETELFYCEKCAILLANQSFKVQRLEGKTAVGTSISRMPLDVTPQPLSPIHRLEQ